MSNDGAALCFLDQIVSTMLFLVGALESETLLLLLAASESLLNARG